MASETFFGLGEGHMPEQAEQIAKKHGAALVNHTEPDGRERHWFAGINRGNPFDAALAEAVMGEIRTAGVEATKECPVCEGQADCDDEHCTDPECYPMSSCTACEHTGRVPLDFDPNA